MIVEPARYTRTEVGGVRCFVGDLPGPARVALVFRAGFVDEQPKHRGWTHLIEHLGFGAFAPADGSEGAVAQHATTFIVEGTDGEVVQRLKAITARLRRLPVERLETELRVLAVEAASDGTSGEKELCLMHFGYTSVGLASLKQLGLRRVDPEALQRFADAAFTRGNAVLVLSRPIEGLAHLGLPSGQWRPSPSADPLRRRAGPAEQALEDAPVALGALVGHSPAAVVLRTLLERRAWEILRHERGLVYDVRVRCLRVAPHERLLLISCDARAQDAGAAARALLGLIEEASHATAWQVEVAQADIRRRHAAAGFSWLVAVATFELTEGDAVPLDWSERVDHVCAEEVCALAHRVGSEVLVSLPRGASAGLPAMQRTYADAVTGTPHPVAAAGRERGLWDVTVGRDGVTASQNGERVTVRYDDCIAAVGDREGSVSLIAADESELVVHPTLHQDGRAAIGHVLNRLPDGVKLPPEPPMRDSQRRRSTLKGPIPASADVSSWLGTRLKLKSGTTTSPDTARDLDPPRQPKPGTPPN